MSFEGWHDVTAKTPTMYDLVELTDGKQIVRGWRSGCNWDGQKVPVNFRPTRYRKLNSYLDPCTGQFAAK